jgi:hypothetical protein
MSELSERIFKLTCFYRATHFNWSRVAKDLASEAEAEGKSVFLHLVLTT